MRNITSFNAASPTSDQQEFSQDTVKDMAWWVKIVTETPQCTYFFGPFESANEAKYNENGYVEDLEQEGAMGIGVSILQDWPQALTIYEEHE